VAPELRFTSKPLDDGVEPLFSIDDVIYYIPKKIMAGVALDALDVMAERGELAGATVLFKRIVGEDAWKALKACKGIDDAGLAALLKIVTDKAMGQLDKLKGE
jgi:hypothetical protein